MINSIYIWPVIVKKIYKPPPQFKQKEEQLGGYHSSSWYIGEAEQVPNAPTVRWNLAVHFTVHHFTNTSATIQHTNFVENLTMKP